jgi:hypothetical protein
MAYVQMVLTFLMRGSIMEPSCFKFKNIALPKLSCLKLNSPDFAYAKIVAGFKILVLPVRPGNLT